MREQRKWSRAGVAVGGLWLAACAAFLAIGLLADSPAHAQPPVAPQAPAGGAPAAGAPAAAAPAGQATPGTKASSRSALRWLYDALKLRYTIAFLFLSFSLVALMVMNILSARRDNIVPLPLVEAFEAHLNEKRYQEAYEMAKADESFLGRVLSAGLAKLQSGYDKALGAMAEVADDENMRLEHRLSYIALIGTLSPMVGLLGTVDGMVQAFGVIAESETQPKPSQLAAGIETALVTTLIGLLLAIPAIAVYNLLRNRMARLVLEVGIISEGLMSRFETVGVKK
ncbi:MAG: MotA/TolQ/ExbB proton channel family protein [Planctomycetia bacterium]|nr:MotA/TolQ/ExbB proton channel family protein [Planctomycetia bacterium]